MATLQEAQTQTQQARQVLEQKKQEVAQVKSQIEQAKSKLPDVNSQRNLRTLSRENRRNIIESGKKIENKREEVKSYEEQVLDPYEEQVSQAEKQISEAQAEQSAYESVMRAYNKGRLWAVAGYGEGREQEIAKELIKSGAEPSLGGELSTQRYQENLANRQLNIAIDNYNSGGLTLDQAFTEKQIQFLKDKGMLTTTTPTIEERTTANNQFNNLISTNDVVNNLLNGSSNMPRVEATKVRTSYSDMINRPIFGLASASSLSSDKSLNTPTNINNNGLGSITGASISNNLPVVSGKSNNSGIRSYFDRVFNTAKDDIEKANSQNLTITQNGRTIITDIPLGSARADIFNPPQQSQYNKETISTTKTYRLTPTQSIYLGDVVSKVGRGVVSVGSYAGGKVQQGFNALVDTSIPIVKDMAINQAKRTSRDLYFAGAVANKVSPYVQEVGRGVSRFTQEQLINKAKRTQRDIVIASYLKNQVSKAVSPYVNQTLEFAKSQGQDFLDTQAKKTAFTLAVTREVEKKIEPYVRQGIELSKEQISQIAKDEANKQMRLIATGNFIYQEGVKPASKYVGENVLVPAGQLASEKGKSFIKSQIPLINLGIQTGSYVAKKTPDVLRFGYENIVKPTASFVNTGLTNFSGDVVKLGKGTYNLFGYDRQALNLKDNSLTLERGNRLNDLWSGIDYYRNVPKKYALRLLNFGEGENPTRLQITGRAVQGVASIPSDISYVGDIYGKTVEEGVGGAINYYSKPQFGLEARYTPTTTKEGTTFSLGLVDLGELQKQDQAQATRLSTGLLTVGTSEGARVKEWGVMKYQTAPDETSPFTKAGYLATQLIPSNVGELAMAYGGIKAFQAVSKVKYLGKAVDVGLYGYTAKPVYTKGKPEEKILSVGGLALLGGLKAGGKVYEKGFALKEEVINVPAPRTQFNLKNAVGRNIMSDKVTQVVTTEGEVSTRSSIMGGISSDVNKGGQFKIFYRPFQKWLGKTFSYVPSGNRVAVKDIFGNLKDVSTGAGTQERYSKILNILKKTGLSDFKARQYIRETRASSLIPTAGGYGKSTIGLDKDIQEIRGVRALVPEKTYVGFSQGDFKVVSPTRGGTPKNVELVNEIFEAKLNKEGKPAGLLDLPKKVLKFSEETKTIPEVTIYGGSEKALERNLPIGKKTTSSTDSLISKKVLEISGEGNSISQYRNVDVTKDISLPSVNKPLQAIKSDVQVISPKERKVVNINYLTGEATTSVNGVTIKSKIPIRQTRVINKPTPSSTKSISDYTTKDVRDLKLTLERVYGKTEQMSSAGTSRLINFPKPPVKSPKLELPSKLESNPIEVIVKPSESTYQYGSKDFFETATRNYEEVSGRLSKGVISPSSNIRIEETQPTIISGRMESSLVIRNDNQQRNNLEVSPKVKLGVISKTKVDLGLKPRIKEDIAPKQREDLVLKNLQKISLEQKIQQKQIQRTQQKQKITQRPKVTQPVKTTIFPPTKESLPQRLAKKITSEPDMFEAFVDIGGKSVSIGKTTSQSEGEQLLKRKISNTLRAGGFLTKGGTPIRATELKGFGGGNFRLSKRNEFKIIEVTNKRLKRGTSEVPEIKAFKRVKSKKSNLFGF